MAIDTFVVFVGVYADVEDAEADYQAVKELHTEAGLLDAYDAAVIVHREDGKGHAAAGMSRHDLHELGEQLDEGQAGLVVVGVADMEARVDEAMKKAEKVEKKQLKADNAAIEADAKEAEKAEKPAS